jgi:glycerophosphoryl diester phosphodiesterase
MYKQYILILAISFSLFKGCESLAQPLLTSPSRPLLICGHRGGFYSDYPENSMAAFNYTFSQASGLPIVIEFDLRKSKQGTLFIMHDNTLDRTTNGSGAINDKTDNYLFSLFLKNAQGQLTQERIPTFEQLLGYAFTREIVLMLDIKDDVWDEALALVKEKGMQGKCVVLSFNSQHTCKAFRLLPEAFISYLDDNPDERDAAATIPLSNRVAYVTSKTTKERIEELSIAGVLIMGDMSEFSRNEGKPFQKQYYLDRVLSQKLGILITDFPSTVSTFFNK